MITLLITALQLYAALINHVRHAFENLKPSRKMPVFEPGEEAGELRIKEWVQDPLILEEMNQ